MKTSVIAPLEEENVRLKAENALLQSDATARQRGETPDGSERRETVERGWKPLGTTGGGGLPDEICVPLHELQADADYLFGRVAADGSVAGVMAASVKAKLKALEEAISAALQPPPRDGGQATGAEPDGAVLARKISDKLHACEWSDGAFLEVDEWEAIMRALCFPTGGGTGTYFRRLPDDTWIYLNHAHQWVTCCDFAPAATLRTSAPPARPSEATVDAVEHELEEQGIDSRTVNVPAIIQAATSASRSELDERIQQLENQNTDLATALYAPDGATWRHHAEREQVVAWSNGVVTFRTSEGGLRLVDTVGTVMAGGMIEHVPAPSRARTLADRIETHFRQHDAPITRYPLDREEAAQVVEALVGARGADRRWLPIETAPKDGTRVLVFGIERSFLSARQFIAWWDEHAGNDGGWRGPEWRCPDPTHWQPLPPAPGEAPDAASTRDAEVELRIEKDELKRCASELRASEVDLARVTAENERLTRELERIRGEREGWKAEAIIKKKRAFAAEAEIARLTARANAAGQDVAGHFTDEQIYRAADAYYRGTTKFGFGLDRMTDDFSTEVLARMREALAALQPEGQAGTSGRAK